MVKQEQSAAGQSVPNIDHLQQSRIKHDNGFGHFNPAPAEYRLIINPDVSRYRGTTPFHPKGWKSLHRETLAVKGLGQDF
jgi:hypothetical protein